jgi:hypothetical protein
VATELEKIDALAPPAPSFLGAHRRALVIGSRTALLMLVIAALAILGLGVVALVRGGGPEVDGMLRTAFGRVFGVVAVGMAVVLGVPAGVGLWSMAGATADDAVPALGATGRRVLVGVAIVTAGASALAVLLDGTASRIVNLGVAGLIALALLGLAGAVSFSPRKGRATMAAVALLVVALGTSWVLVRVVPGSPV